MARDYSGLKHHAKVHSFRIATAIVAWILIAGIFYYRPDWIKWGLRGATHGIEAVGDSLPYPWGDRIEIVLRELGGIIWLQITAVILLLRVVLSSHRIGVAVSTRPLTQSRRVGKAKRAHHLSATFVLNGGSLALCPPYEAATGC